MLGNAAWVQVSEGSIPVKAMFKSRVGYRFAGAVVVEVGCWTMLKGGLTVDQTGVAELYFEVTNFQTLLRTCGTEFLRCALNRILP